ncbi:unnamed protein product, partial [Iphiclides podalirius]
MLRIIFAIYIGVLFAKAGRSPHADYIEQLVKSDTLKPFISDNIYEDARLDVPGLVQKYKYPLEVHNVTTPDGYILQIHRIPYGRHSNNRPDPKKPVVFLMHGLLSSSADWVVMGPGTAFGYILAEEGFDVWMVAYMAHNRSPLFNALAPHANNIESLASLIGIGEFLPNTIIMSWAGETFCKDAAITQDICSNIMFLIGGWNKEQHNATMLPVILGHAPAGAALRQFAHYGQGIAEKGFRRYDHGWLTNLRKYGSRRPPNYELSNIVVPVFLHYSDNDPLAHVNDVDRLFHELKAGIKMRPGLIRKYKYPLEVHNVTTPDGYILQMHRIPHGRHSNNRPDPKKPVVFLMHGLLCSSADWVVMGPGSGFGYILAEEGFDVWMGNARGNYYSRRHVRLNPNGILNTKFWEFSWDEIGNIDLPTMIDYVLKNTEKDKLHYVGHSQGTTAFFVMASLQPQYNTKIISMHAFAPVAYMAHNRSPLFNALAPHANNIESLASLIGIGEFLPNNIIMSWAGETFCNDAAITQDICSNIMFLIGGWNKEQHNATMLPVILGHTPAGAAIRQFAHYGQGIAEKGFRRYDHGWVTNLRKYGSRRPPNYKLSNIVVPVFLHYSDSDPLAHVNDVDRLFHELKAGIKMRVPLKLFSHLDFIWGIDAKTLLYDRAINLIRSVENQS